MPSTSKYSAMIDGCAESAAEQWEESKNPKSSVSSLLEGLLGHALKAAVVKDGKIRRVLQGPLSKDDIADALDDVERNEQAESNESGESSDE